MPLDRVTRSLLRAAAIAAVVLGAWYAVRGVSWPELRGALGRTDVPYVVGLSLPLLALSTLVRTARYAALLPGETRFGDVWTSVVVSAAANNVLPLRAGELLRTRATTAIGVGLGRVAFAQLTEKVIEAVTLVAWAAPVLAAYTESRSRVALTAAGVALALASLTVTLRYRRPELLRGVVRSVGWSFVADAIEIATVAVCLHALGLTAGLVRSVTVFAAVNLAIALPSTPGNLGAMEAGAALPLITLGVDRDAAIAFALVYRVVQWLPVTVLGGSVLFARRSRLAAAGAS